MKKLSALVSIAILFGTAFVIFWNSINADASGANRFIVYQSNGDIFIRRSTDNGATWKSPVNLSSNPGPSVSPALLVSGTNVYVAWQQDSTGLDSALYFRSSANNGASWGPKLNIDSIDRLICQHPPCAPNLAASGSNVYIAWLDSGLGIEPGIADVSFIASDDKGATWKESLWLTRTSDKEETDLSISASGTSVFVMYKLGPIQVQKSTDGGVTWKLTKSLSQ